MTTDAGLIWASAELDTRIRDINNLVEGKRLALRIAATLPQIAEATF